MAGGLLFANDLTAESRRVAATAVEVAKRLGLTVSVVHVVTEDELESFRRDVPEESGYVDVLFGQLRSRIEADLRTLDADLNDGGVEIRVVRGEPDEAVLKELKDGGFEFGVIGVRSRSRVSKLVFGSAAQSILLLSPCPIIAVPTGETS